MPESAIPSRVCELCRRPATPLTRHHLLPRSRHNKPRFERHFSRQEGRERIALLCRACHSCVHSVLTEKQLEQQYNTLEALRAHEEIARFTAWLASKPPGFQPLSRRPKRES